MNSLATEAIGDAAVAAVGHQLAGLPVQHQHRDVGAASAASGGLLSAPPGRPGDRGLTGASLRGGIRGCLGATSVNCGPADLSPGEP